MRLDELLAAYKHAAGPATRVVDAAFVWGEYLDQHTDDVRWGVELAAAFPLCASKACEEVFIDSAEGIFCALGSAAERNIAYKVDDLSEALFVEAGTCE